MSYCSSASLYICIGTDYSYSVLFANKVGCQKIALCRYYFIYGKKLECNYYSPHLIIGIWKNIYLSEMENTFFRYLKYWFLQISSPLNIYIKGLTRKIWQLLIPVNHVNLFVLKSFLNNLHSLQEC